MNEEVFQAIGEALQRGEPAALVTIIRTQGSTPQRVGAKMLVFADGRSVGTIEAAATRTTRSGRHARHLRPGSHSWSATSSRTTSPRNPD